MTQWHYAHNGQQFGPVSDQQLKQLADSGQLLPTDMVWKKGMAQWVKAARIDDLFFGLPLVPTTTQEQARPAIVLGPSEKAKGFWAGLNTTQKAFVAGGIVVAGLFLLSCMGMLSMLGLIGRTTDSHDKRSMARHATPEKPSEDVDDHATDEESASVEDEEQPMAKSGSKVRKRQRDDDDEASVELILKIRRGMPERQVTAILGPPHEIQENVIDAIPALNQPRKVVTTWTYNPNTKNFMVFAFVNGRCDGGESGGYDIEKGLKVPGNIRDILQKNK